MQFIDLNAQYQSIKASIDQRIQTVLDHGRFIMGPEVTELENRLAEFTGVRHCIGVSSGTDALQIAMMALGIGPGDEVITTPFSFIATAETIILLGAVPVFVDIDPETFNMDPALVEAAITPATRAIMPVSLYGQCADFDVINAIARRHRLPVIEDGAQSFGATCKGTKSCALSTIGCTSFFPSKPLGAYGDAGACFTDDDDLAAAMKQIRVHGQDRRYHHPRIGVNGRLDTIQAAVLLAKLEIFPQEIQAREQIGSRYSSLLADAPIQTPVIRDHNTSVYAQYTVQVEDRERIRAALEAHDIPTAVHYPLPLNRQPVLNRNVTLPESDRASTRVMSLPMHPLLTKTDQDFIVKTLYESLEQL